MTGSSSAITPNRTITLRSGHGSQRQRREVGVEGKRRNDLAATERYGAKVRAEAEKRGAYAGPQAFNHTYSTIFGRKGDGKVFELALWP